jgi:hypothetical protein
LAKHKTKQRQSTYLLFILEMSKKSCFHSVFGVVGGFFVSEKVTRKNTFARYWALFDEDFYINPWAGTDFHVENFNLGRDRL